MNFILNECSLRGQFESVEAFLKSLEANLKCFRLVRSQSDGEIRKIADFYKCKITKDQRLGDLKQFPKSEELLRLMIALDKFVEHESWEAIGLDDGLEYKKYAPSSSEEDWFLNSVHRNRTIMKFRFSSRMRCFGYRKGDRFRLLRIERDHRRSDKG